MSRGGWDELAAWRDYRMGEEGDLWHRAIIDPTFLRVIGPVRGLSILDLACGNGYLTRRWARRGAARVVGVDRSEPTLAGARRRERDDPTGAEFLRRDSTHLAGLADASFDLVAANMALMDIRELDGTLREVARVLRPQGRLVFSIGHPCFDLDDRSEWLVERGRGPRAFWRETVWRKIRGYREERTLRVPWDVADGEIRWTTSYHRTLTTYSAALAAAGFAITRLEEPQPTPEAVRGSPQGKYLLEIPLHLVVEARPLHGLGPARGRRAGARRSGSRTSAGSPSRATRRSGSRARTRRTGSSGQGSTSGS